MAIRYAIKNGNWSDPTTWNGGVSLPGPTDDVRSNGFTVTIDAGDWQVKSITNGSETSPVVAIGGEFIAKNGATIRSDTLTSRSFGHHLIRCVDPSPAVVNIYSTNIDLAPNSPSSTDVSTIRLESTGTINIYATSIIIGISAGNGSAITDTSTANGVINIEVDTMDSFNLLSITKIITMNSNSTYNIQANQLIHSNTSPSGGTNHIYNTGTGTINLTANLIKGGDFNDDRITVINLSTGRININGPIEGGTGSPAILNSSSGVISQIGDVKAGSGAPAVGIGSTTQITLLTGPFFGDPNGSQAVAAQAWRWNLNSQSTYMTVYSTDLLNPDQIFLYTADYLNGSPSPSDVRSGVTFGPVGEFFGTMAVPDPSDVSSGTPVDHVVGTAVITADELWGYPLEQMTVPGSVGARFRHVITEELLGKYLAAFGAYDINDLPNIP